MKHEIEAKIDQEALSLITDIAYANVPSWYGATRRDLRMDIIAPKVRTKEKKLPLMIWFCGGAFRVLDKSVWIPELMYFAENGYVVASVEYRTSIESVFPEPLKDGKAAVRYLKAHAKEYCIDPDRVVVMGESAGGTMALQIGVTAGMDEFEEGDYLEQDSSVSAVVDYYGLCDMAVSIENGTEDVPPWILKDYLGIHYTKEEEKRASAISYVNENTPPMFILHGQKDDLVPISTSEELYDRLQKAGVPSELCIIKDAGHGDDAFYQKNVNDMILEFLSRVL